MKSNEQNFVMYDNIINENDGYEKTMENNSDNVGNNLEKPKKKFSNFKISEGKNKLSNFSIKVIGLGGAGCNVIKDIFDKHPQIKKYATLYALNTDVNSLELLVGVDNLYLLDKENLSGYGSGGNPIVGQNAIKHDAQAIKEELKNTDLLFIIAGMGKGTGSGGAPELAKIAKELGILTVGIISMPSLACEGNNIYNSAYAALHNFKDHCDALTTISNEKIINNEKGISFIQAYEKANDKIASIIEEIVDIIFVPSKINIDFADIKNFFNKNKFFMMTKTIFNETNQQKPTLLEQITKSVNESYSDIDINDAKNIIINLSISNETPSTIVENIRKNFISITKNSSVSLTTGINSIADKKLSLTAIISGKLKNGFEDILEKTSSEFLDSSIPNDYYDENEQTYEPNSKIEKVDDETIDDEIG